MVGIASCDMHQLMLFDRRQKITETVLEYAEELRKLAKLAYPELDSRARDNLLRPILLRGIKTQVKDVIKFREYDSLADAIKSATFVETQLFRDDLLTYNNKIAHTNLVSTMQPVQRYRNFGQSSFYRKPQYGQNVVLRVGRRNTCVIVVSITVRGGPRMCGVKGNWNDHNHFVVQGHRTQCPHDKCLQFLATIRPILNGHNHRVSLWSQQVRKIHLFVLHLEIVTLRILRNMIK